MTTSTYVPAPRLTDEEYKEILKRAEKYGKKLDEENLKTIKQRS